MNDTVDQTAQVPIVSKIKAVLSLDPYWSDFDDLTSRIRQLNREDRKRLLGLGEEALELEEVRRVETLRVGTIKVILALTPESATNIRNWIVEEARSYTYEVHFTLFCFLDRILNSPDTSKFIVEVGELLEEYLLRVKSESAHAAWMAGDLLGDHWPLNVSLPILTRAATRARFVAGRLGAIHGLAHALKRLPQARKRPVTALLKEVAKSDVSGNVRMTARLILEKHAV